MTSSCTNGTYTFDRFKLDADKLMLYRDGEELSIRPKVVQTLLVLVQNRGEILSKDELIRTVWSDAVVEESNLAQHLYQLRKLLGLRPDGQAYIETLRRRGYRFANVDVSFEEADDGPAPQTAVSAPASQRFTVERRGNVVAVVDWKEQEEAAVRNDLPRIVDPAGSRSQGRGLYRALIVAILATSLSAVAIGTWLFSPPAAQVAEEHRPGLVYLPVTNGENVNLAAISRDGKYFTYHEIDGEFARMVVQQTGHGKVLEVLPRARRSIGPKSFSPDGRFIYFHSKEAGADHSSIYRIPTLGGVMAKVVDNASSYPTFSPDGKWIAFHRTDPPTGRSSLVISADDGSNERTLLAYEKGRLIAPNPAWSPDGAKIAFGELDVNSGTDGPCTLATVEIATGTVGKYSTERWDTCYRIEWRRDGKGLVFVGTKKGDGATIRRDQVYYVSVEGMIDRLTVDIHRNQGDSLGITDQNEVLCVPFSRSSQIWVMDPNGQSKTAVRLTNGSSDGRAGLVPLADGRIAFTTRTGENLGAWIIDADGGNRHQFISDPPIIEELRGTPDGTSFYFASSEGGRSHLFRVDSNGLNLKQITDGDYSQTDSAISPDGKWLIYDSMESWGNERRSLWKTPVEGGTPTQISNVKCATPNSSSSGKLISCVWGNDIYVISAADGSLVNKFNGSNNPILNIGARFSPDETSLVYIVSRDGTTNLWIQPLNGKQPRQLTDFPNGDIYNFAYSPDGSKLYLARGFQVRDAVLIRDFE